MENRIKTDNRIAPIAVFITLPILIYTLGYFSNLSYKFILTFTFFKTFFVVYLHSLINCVNFEKTKIRLWSGLIAFVNPSLLHLL